jgi:1-acyl-sn-glycerol-3-phosphate acyltransferase
MIANIRGALKTFWFAFCCTFYFLIGFPVSLFVDRFPIGSRKFLIRHMNFIVRLVLKGLNFHVHINGHRELLDEKDTKLIVSNHLSYLDILVMTALKPACSLPQSK